MWDISIKVSGLIGRLKTRFEAVSGDRKYSSIIARGPATIFDSTVLCAGEGCLAALFPILGRYLYFGNIKSKH